MGPVPPQELLGQRQAEILTHKATIEELSLHLQQHQSDLKEAQQQLREARKLEGEVPPDVARRLTSLENSVSQYENELVETRSRLLEAHNNLEPMEHKSSRAEARASILQRELHDAMEQITQLEKRLAGE